MNFYLDTEFIERFHKPFLGQPKHVIDLISIGIINEKGDTYYAISRDFNPAKASQWVRENVLNPIIDEFIASYSGDQRNKILNDMEDFGCTHNIVKSTVFVQSHIGKSNKQIAQEIQLFTAGFPLWNLEFFKAKNMQEQINHRHQYYPPVFYGYYADYDWVLFCSLFGTMMDLPEGYPMYCRDLKQTMDELGLDSSWKDNHVPEVNQHNAREDARWNKSLHHHLNIHNTIIKNQQQ